MSDTESKPAKEKSSPDEIWETIIANPKPLPRLDSFLGESAEEADELFDPIYL